MKTFFIGHDDKTLGRLMISKDFPWDVINSWCDTVTSVNWVPLHVTQEEVVTQKLSNFPKIAPLGGDASDPKAVRCLGYL